MRASNTSMDWVNEYHRKLFPSSADEVPVDPRLIWSLRPRVLADFEGALSRGIPISLPQAIKIIQLISQCGCKWAELSATIQGWFHHAIGENSLGIKKIGDFTGVYQAAMAKGKIGFMCEGFIAEYKRVAKPVLAKKLTDAKYPERLRIHHFLKGLKEYQLNWDSILETEIPTTFFSLLETYLSSGEIIAGHLLARLSDLSDAGCSWQQFSKDSQELSIEKVCAAMSSVTDGKHVRRLLCALVWLDYPLYNGDRNSAAFRGALLEAIGRCITSKDAPKCLWALAMLQLQADCPAATAVVDELMAKAVGDKLTKLTYDNLSPAVYAHWYFKHFFSKPLFTSNVLVGAYARLGGVESPVISHNQAELYRLLGEKIAGDRLTLTEENRVIGRSADMVCEQLGVVIEYDGGIHHTMPRYQLSDKALDNLRSRYGYVSLRVKLEANIGGEPNPAFLVMADHLAHALIKHQALLDSADAELPEDELLARVGDIYATLQAVEGVLSVTLPLTKYQGSVDPVPPQLGGAGLDMGEPAAAAGVSGDCPGLVALLDSVTVNQLKNNFKDVCSYFKDKDLPLPEEVVVKLSEVNELIGKGKKYANLAFLIQGIGQAYRSEFLFTAENKERLRFELLRAAEAVFQNPPYKGRDVVVLLSGLESMNFKPGSFSGAFLENLGKCIACDRRTEGRIRAALKRLERLVAPPLPPGPPARSSVLAPAVAMFAPRRSLPPAPPLPPSKPMRATAAAWTPRVAPPPPPVSALDGGTEESVPGFKGSPSV
ncbi:MAG: hypothetical protein P1U63_11375 [Coxiellaceae bacterium]|nr:hypothetical protein [Coxiellaceae bacterium]